MNCVGVYGEGCFRPGDYTSGRCAACYRGWLRHSKPEQLGTADETFDGLVTAVDKYMNSGEVSDKKLAELKAIVDLKVAAYAPHIIGADKVKQIEHRRIVKTAKGGTMAVEEVIRLVLSMSRDDRRRVYRSIIKLPPEVARERRAERARIRGLQCSKEFLKEIGKRGNAARWAKAQKPDA